MLENRYTLTKRGKLPIKESDSYTIKVTTTDREFLDFMDEKLDAWIEEYKLGLKKE